MAVSAVQAQGVVFLSMSRRRYGSPSRKRHIVGLQDRH